MKPIEKLAIVINKNKEGAEALARDLSQCSKEQGVTTVMTTEYPIPSGFLSGQDACCVIGGDGTLLGVVTESVNNQVPVYGINQGKLGFLVTLSASKARNEFINILKGKYKIEERAVLCCKAEGGGEEALALNDVVIKQELSTQIIELVVYSSDQLITTYSCDGVIFATSTGSTAYNLSAGGPIICPGSNVFSMTPICPHTLSNRSIILGHNENITVHCSTSNIRSQVTLDGSTYFKEKSFPVHIKIYEKGLPLLQPLSYSYFRILRSKLKWGD